MGRCVPPLQYSFEKVDVDVDVVKVATSIHGSNALGITPLVYFSISIRIYGSLSIAVHKTTSTIFAPPNGTN